MCVCVCVCLCVCVYIRDLRDCMQNFGFLNCHSPIQDLMALALLNPAVPLKSFPNNNFEVVSYLSMLYFILELYLRTTDASNNVH